MRKLLTLMLLLACSIGVWADQYPDKLYVAGDATSTGWLANTRTILYKTSNNNYQGFVNFTTQDGEVKFLVTNEFNRGQWGAETNGVNIESSDPIKLTYTDQGWNDTDKKFKFKLETGIYLVSIDAADANNATVKFEKWNDEESVMEIGTKGGLEAFAYAVNNFDQNIKAKLTADIKAGDITPIGTVNNPYTGVFDGGYHIIDVAIEQEERDEVGLFGVINGGSDSNKTTIKNLIVTGSVKGKAYVGGIVGGIKDGGGGNVSIENCGNEAAITASAQNAGGILGCRRGSARIEISYCYNAGKISGEKESAGISGWLGDNFSVSSTYNIGEVTGVDGKNYFARPGAGAYNDCTGLAERVNERWTSFTDDQIRNGTMMGQQGEDSRLNKTGEFWAQKGAKPLPIGFFGKEITVDSKDAYDFVLSRVNTIGITDVNVNLGCDLSDGVNTAVGTTTNRYQGTFNGNGHKVTLNIDNANNYQGLIGCATGNAIIKNVTTFGFVKGTAFCGGILGGSTGGGNISVANCGNEAAITASAENAGGVVGCNHDNATYTLTNCYNAGNIVGKKESAGISGWLGGNAKVTNCYNIGSVDGIDTDGRSFARWGNGTYENCYNKLSAKNPVSGRTDNYPTDKVTSGELCAALGDAFTQDLSAEGHPTFGSKAVKADKWFNDANNDVYYNEEDGNITVYQLNMDEANTVYNVPANVTAKNVKMTRNIGTDKWNTFVSPVAIDKTVFSEVKELTGVTVNGDNYSMTFTDADAIEAGKPYMVKVNEAVTELTATNVTLAAVKPTTFNGLTFQGVYTNGKAPEGSFIISNNKFYNVDSDVTLKAFRGYITVDAGAGAKTVTFDFDENADAIKTIEDGKLNIENAAIYNLAGQRVQKMQKGINIVNGKKVMF